MLARAGTAILAVLVVGCGRERRDPRGLGPAVAAASVPAVAPGGGNPYVANAWGIAQGKRLYSWFNCVGCHGNGGGGMGPPLMDATWIYGGEPIDIYTSIARGRPNGMPAFGGLLSPDQIWQLAAYVQSLSGAVRHDAAPGRADAMQSGEPELLRSHEEYGAPDREEDTP